MAQPRGSPEKGRPSGAGLGTGDGADFDLARAGQDGGGRGPGQGLGHANRRRPDGLTLCVGAAVALRPEGPFIPRPEPLTCGGTHGVIDASPFRDGDDLWLYVKTDGNCCRTPVEVMAIRLTADGLSQAAPPVRLDGVAHDEPWEGQVVEAPQMIRHEGRYWLFYSAANYGGADYAMGYARCRGPVGPCVDAAENPILRTSDPQVGPIGPGH